MKIPLLIKRITGQSLMEFTLVLPILFLLIFGIVDFSRLAYGKILVNQAAKEMGRMTSIGTDITLIKDRVGDLLKSLTGETTSFYSAGTDDQGNLCTIITLIPYSGHEVAACVSPPYTTDLAEGAAVRISVLYRLKFITPLAGILGNIVDIKEVYYTRIEKSPSQ